MKIKTRLDILTDIEDELCVRLPIHIFPSDTNFNDRWVSVDSLKQVIYEYQQINDLNVGLDEMLIERLENALISNSVKAKTNKD